MALALVELVSRVIDEGYAPDLDDEEIELVGRDPFLMAYALRDPGSDVSSRQRCRGPHAVAVASVERHCSDTCGIELLCLACQSLDRAEELQSLIDHAGVGSIHSESGLVRSNPMVKDELAARAFVSKTLERLGLNNEAPKQVGRPTESWSNANAKKSSA